nr:polysaccharide pyruvyl transferase family protein [uncultured Blautia sp.]
MLQAYATVSMLENCEIPYELIQYEKKRTLVEIVKSMPRLLNGVLLNDKYEAFLKKQGFKKHPEFAENDAIRMKAFEIFKNQKFTKLSPVFKGYAALCEGGKKYSAVITGSDQLWSPAGLPTNYYNLMFVPDDTLKISIASSFGVKEIPWYQKKRTIQYLNRIEYISMRENRGSEIVKELTGRDVPTILDPVFFLSKKEWLERIPNKREINEPYIFAYFLGTTQEYRNAVKKLAHDKGMKVVALRHMDQYVEEDENFGDFAPYDVSPERFLNLLRNAEYVCTDSFHGTAFSILNEKQFVVFNRYAENSSFSKNSRIDTLCVNFGLESRRYKNGMDLSDVVKDDIDYKAVGEKYKNLKLATNQYLNIILKEIRKRV